MDQPAQLGLPLKIELIVHFLFNEPGDHIPGMDIHHHERACSQPASLPAMGAQGSPKCILSYARVARHSSALGRMQGLRSTRPATRASAD